MKLTRGKISKLYNKKKQTLKKLKNRKTSYRRKTIVNKRRVNLARGTLKKFNYTKNKSIHENAAKYETTNSDISLVDKNIIENLTTKNTNEIVDEPLLNEQIVEEPALKEPVKNEPITEEQIIEEPINEQIIEEPVTKESVTEQPVLEEPVTKESIIEKSVLKEQIVDEPVLKEPVINEEPGVLDELISIDLNELIVENEDNEDGSKEIEEL